MYSSHMAVPKSLSFTSLSSACGGGCAFLWTLKRKTAVLSTSCPSSTPSTSKDDDIGSATEARRATRLRFTGGGSLGSEDITINEQMHNQHGD